MKITGKIGTFGGPEDDGVGANEGLALYEPSQVQTWWDKILFLPYQPEGTTGLARKLNPDAYYVALRWGLPYGKNGNPSKSELRNSVVLVKNPKSGKSIWCRPCDWGPNTITGRDIDLAPGAAYALGLITNDTADAELFLPSVEEDVTVPEIPENRPGKNIVLSIGHHPDAQGAENRSYNICEWEYNSVLAELIDHFAQKAKITIVHRDKAKWDKQQIDRIINSKNPDYTIELHANAYNRKVSGTEMWVFPGSDNAFELALKIQNAVVKALDLEDRGIKFSDTFTYLRRTNAPAVRVESFFIDNDNDTMIGLNRREELAKAIAKVLDAL